MNFCIKLLLNIFLVIMISIFYGFVSPKFQYDWTRICGFQVIRENWNLKYSACFVICPLPKESPMSNKVPEAVSVVARLRAIPTNRILVQNRHESRTNDKESLAICVKPLHYYYNRVCSLHKSNGWHLPFRNPYWYLPKNNNHHLLRPSIGFATGGIYRAAQAPGCYPRHSVQRYRRSGGRLRPEILRE